MNENEGVGKRVHVTSKNGRSDLGLGTYLFAGEILLDTGKKIQGANCTWKVVQAKPVPPFKITIAEPTRVFEGRGTMHVLRDVVLTPGQAVTIEKIYVAGWNHGMYVAGRFNLGGNWYALIMSEVKLPEEKASHLRVVK